MHANTRPSPLAPNRRPVGLLVAGLFLVAPLGSLLAQDALAAPAKSGALSAPRAALMPVAPQKVPASLPPLPLSVQAPQKAPVLRAARPVTTLKGGGKFIEIAKSGALAGLGDKKKVIQVPNLTLPPLSTPLPSWMQAASVRVDKLEKTKTRLAQNPAAPPVRNPRAPVTSSDRLPNQIEVATSTFVVLLTTTDLQTVAVADPSIADVAVVNSRAVLLNGKGSGVTSLVIVDGQKIRQYSVRVTAAPNQTPPDIAEAIGIPGVTVRTVMGAVVLNGEVGSEVESKRAGEIAGIYAPNKVVNQLTVRGDDSASGTARAVQISDLIGLPGVTVRMSGETAILSGNVETDAQMRDAATVAATVTPKVLNLLKTPPMSLDQLRESFGLTPLVSSDVSLIADAGNAPAPLAPTMAPTAGVPNINLASPLSIRQVAGQIILEGEVESESEVQRLLAEAARTGLPISNRLRVRAALSAGQALALSAQQAINNPGVRVSGSANRLILQGLVNDTNDAVSAEQIARSFAPQVDNLLQTPNPILVDVDISIVEISTNELKNLGFQFPALQDSSALGFVIGQQSASFDTPGPLQPIIDPASKLQTGTNRNFRQQTAFQAALRAEARDNKVRLLSNPRTTVLSGRTATFQVGGQVPIPVNITQTSTGTVTSVQFKDFGVLVDVVPNASPNGNVTMRLRTEVSQPDPSIGFQPIAGAGIIPGFTRRATVSEVTIPRGGTIALGGLISNENRKLITRVPVLSNIPILGALFKSKRFQDLQTELVIFVTPRVLPNTLAPGTTVAAGVVAAGNTINAGTVLGNPGIAQFNVGGAIATGGGTPQ